MSEGTILKFGGSVITDKAKDCAIDYERLESIASEIAKRERFPLIIVHGAGSCGHPQARKYQLGEGLSSDTIEGVYFTHSAVRKLNDAVVEGLRRNGIPAIGVHPLDLCLTENGRLTNFEYRPLTLMVQLGMVPVLHGDVVMDTKRGAAILSGDQLISSLARSLHFKRVGVATDVNGVLRDGEVIPILSTNDVSTVAIGESRYTDVTGGMRGKLAELITLAVDNIESHIFHISRLGNFLDGIDHGGTIITWRETK